MAFIAESQTIELLNESQVSELTGIKVKTLQNWRCAMRELPFVKMGGKVRYEKAKILEYIAQHRRVPSVRASSRIAHDTY